MKSGHQHKSSVFPGLNLANKELFVRTAEKYGKLKDGFVPLLRSAEELFP
eukprot:CAMPEP_0185588524 /NCGR_PEP_ID=MMETSP0434-20130131/53457_1 /TAXON_ID=626734 ORGANISM="Favella taraikaensis, Strain Fe Narragansett Bay" /NCGR_SAMPLE_ID=MMETSP0434 /ASSEMBLY_ACC=CAM_ASM_000379 /LENGTH=49 /DNA_ID=CAMNT_0028211259 /DNA_START=12 /DNA_END=161 /DNA_ORIENTATION=-